MTLHHNLARIEGLRKLQRRFDNFILDEERPIHVALFEIMKECCSQFRCCDDAGIVWSAKITSHEEERECIYVEWECEFHGSGHGSYVPLEYLAREMTS